MELTAKTARIAAALVPTILLMAAGCEGSEANYEQRIRTVLQQRFPDVPIRAIEPAQVPGLYAVVTERDVVYTDSHGDYLLLGQVMETATRRNLTTLAWNRHHPITFTDLNLNDAIVTRRGSGTRRLAVFSDPLCPFCRAIEPELAKLNDVTIYTFLYPVESLHAGASARARAIWCADDREAAWRAWMIKSTEPPARACDAKAIEANLALGTRLRVTSTPTIFLADGRRLTGALVAADFERELSKVVSSAVQAVGIGRDEVRR